MLEKGLDLHERSRRICYSTPRLRSCVKCSKDWTSTTKASFEDQTSLWLWELMLVSLTSLTAKPWRRHTRPPHLRLMPSCWRLRRMNVMIRPRQPRLTKSITKSSSLGVNSLITSMTIKILNNETRSILRCNKLQRFWRRTPELKTLKQLQQTRSRAWWSKKRRDDFKNCQNSVPQIRLTSQRSSCNC